MTPRGLFAAGLLGLLVVAQCATTPEREWLAGDSHIHSHWSTSYDTTTEPPSLTKGGEALYSTPHNAQMARRFGLSWMVTTDHGGPNHAKLNLTDAYPELQQSRGVVPEVLQFYGMELNMPGMDHHTLIMPHTESEASVLYEIEQRFDALEVWPPDPERDTEAARIRVLNHIRSLTTLPVLFANHPSRSATAIGVYGQDEPGEIRDSNDRAPEVYRGMEGAPGHQAATLDTTGRPRPDRDGELTRFRGVYNNPGAHTLGGFDQMTAVLGGVWDALLGEGRRFWIVASSDSHVHYTETARPGVDFWPGEFHKTYVYARRTYQDVLDGLRHGRVFVTAGDLVTRLDLSAGASGGTVGAGGTLQIATGEDVVVSIQFRDPETPNAGGENPVVDHLDVIIGEVHGPVTDREADHNPTTRLHRRLTSADWTSSGDLHNATLTLRAVTQDSYVRVRGTNTAAAEPAMDTPGEDPWADLWFYSNPIFIEVE